MFKTLAIETSCDDTSIGIVSFDEGRFEVEKLLAYSQVADHQKYGGVMPEIASRLHSEKIIGVLEAVGWKDIADAENISVTTHPGLPGSLVVGKAVGATLASWYNKPMIEVNHIHGHIFSLFLERNINDFQFPMVVLTASGGHNDLYLIEKGKLDSRPNSAKDGTFGGQSGNDIEIKINNSTLNTQHSTQFKITNLGKTLDDAAGECFDKVSRMLGGPYPGGPRISEMADRYKIDSRHLSCKGNGQSGNDIVKFKRIFLSKEGFDFSFSGMKSQVSTLLKNFEKQNITLTDDLICAIAYEFQEAVVEVLAKKLAKAGLKYGAKTLGISGGVSANDRLWEYVNDLIQHKNYINQNFSIFKPAKKVYSTDNAAMIGVAGIMKEIGML